MPETLLTNLIISLTPPLSSGKSLDELGTGFLFNSFADSHPIKPFHIKADLIVGKDLQINPSVGSEQLDSFIETLKESVPVRKKSVPGRTPSNSFESIVQKALNEIEKGSFEKVVLSRVHDISLPENFSLMSFFDELCDQYPNAFCSMVHLPDEGVWVGATPELLISDNSTRFKTISLAGTKVMEQEQALSDIAWTQKEIEEQAFVSRYVINCFKKIRLREFYENGPKTIKAGNLAHLRTEFEVKYSEVQFEKLADQMLELLHPTSAVCGMPLEPARDFILENEGYDRLFYSGFLGPVNFNESTDLFVNLRCMSISGSHARLYAGAGITHDSNPQKEMKETEMKMVTLMRIVQR